MRSAREIQFRLRQEFRNLWHSIAPPRVQPLDRIGNLKCAAKLRETNYAADTLQRAELILQHKFPMFGTVVETGPEIDWRRDYISGKTSGLSYFRLIPYLDASRVGDHKWIWELNRHQHLVTLAQAHLLQPDRRYVAEIERQIVSWFQQNPFERGINWASALEVAFRAMSWLWVLRLIGITLDRDVTGQMEQGLYQHSVFLENNLSVYFSPNTHLLGEAVALHAIGTWMPGFPNAKRIRELGQRIVREQTKRQVREDGSYFEQSSYYHVYALDMLLFHAILAGREQTKPAVIERMADFLYALISPTGKLPLIGDDDGGKWFNPIGDPREYGWATLATCNAYFGEERWPVRNELYAYQAAWWIDGADRSPALAKNKRTQQSSSFRHSGLIVMRDADTAVIFDAGPFGPGSAGHSHSDTLSVLLSVGGKEWLVDPGTYTYVAGEGRDSFRNSAAHNTVRINGLDQATPGSSFRWNDPPKVELLEWSSTDQEDTAIAVCRYRGFTHARWVRFVKGACVLVVDFVDGPPGDHLLEQFWHLADDTVRFVGLPERLEGWRSVCYGQREPAPILRVSREAVLPVVIPAAIIVNPETVISVEQDKAVFTVDDRRIEVDWPKELR